MFRKIFILLICLLLASPCFAQNDYFWVPDCATPGDGTTGECDGGADDAFDNLSDFEAVAVAGDVLWMRRTKTETMSASFALTQDGTEADHIYWIGWPRDALTITSATWTNGSTTVDVILPASMTWSTVCGRFVTGPDGFDYLITLVTDTNTLTIDRPYAGTTVTLTDGASSIKADELPRGVTQPADPDSWDSDADSLAKIDLSGGAYGIEINADEYRVFNGIDFLGGTANLLTIQSVDFQLTGCLLNQPNNNNPIYYVSEIFRINRCIIKGSGGNNSSNENNFSGITYISNSAIYGMGDFGIVTNGSVLDLTNVNIGVEIANTDDDLSILYGNSIIGRDVKLGGTNGDVYAVYSDNKAFISVNNNKVLGAWKMFFLGGTAEKVAVTNTNANKKLSDNVIEITPDTTNALQFKEIEHKVNVFESRKTYAAGTYNIKLWIYNDTGNTLNDTTFSDDILMRCRAEAGNYGDATTEYVSMPWTYSDEIDILDAADADDWDYLQCDSVVVDVSGSKIYCEILVSTYDAGADVILIDPSTTNP